MASRHGSAVHAAAGAALALLALASPAGAQAPPAAPAPSAHCAGAVGPAGTSRLQPMRSQPFFEDVAFVDQDGHETTLRTVLDTELPVLLNFIFTTCTTVCPIMSTGFARFQEALESDRDRVRLVSVSIDPDNDSVEVLRAYAERFRAGNGWRLLTGTRDASVTAQRAFGAYRGDKMNHAPATYVRRGRGEPWQVVDGLASAEILREVWRDLSHDGR